MKKSRLNIIIYNGDLDLATFVFNLGKYLRKEGHQVTFMGHSQKFFSYRKAGIKYCPLPYQNDKFSFYVKAIQLLMALMVRSPHKLPKLFSTIYKVWKDQSTKRGEQDLLMDFIRLSACQLINPHLVHNQNSPALNALAPIFHLYPIFQSLHGKLEDLSPFHNPTVASIYKKYFPKVSGFQSDSDLSWQNARLFGAYTNNVFISYSLIEQNLLSFPLKSNFKNDTDFNIISVGKFIWKKGFIHALEAMHMLKNHLNFHYTIIGGGDQTAAKFHINDLGLEHHVTLKSNIPHDQVFDNIHQSDLFLLPSLQEGFATVVSEAMAIGTPVVSTDCSGMKELLRHQ